MHIGEQTDYFYSKDLIGFTRTGDYEHADSGFAVVLTDKDGGEINMNIGKNNANSLFYDVLGNIEEKVYIDSERKWKIFM